jgi:tetratricopeptide (TPR) repeat protein
MRLPGLASIALVVAVAVAAPLGAAADDLPMSPPAYEHLQKGLEAYRNKQYDQAIAEFEQGYRLEPRKEFLFAWAQAERLSGHCDKAIDLYGRFIATGPSQAQLDAAKTNLDRCRQALEVQPAAPVAPSADEAAKAAPAATPPTLAAPAASVRAPRARRPFYEDPLGDGLVAAGVVGLGFGLGFEIAAGSAEDAADRAPTYDAFAHDKDTAASRRTVAAVSTGLGVALVAAGTLRWIMVAGKEAPAAPTGRNVSIAPSAGGATVWVWGSF